MKKSLPRSGLDESSTSMILRAEGGSEQDGVLTLFSHCGWCPQEFAAEEEGIYSLPLIPEFPEPLDTAVIQQSVRGY
jgi:hypothetical protein